MQKKHIIFFILTAFSTLSFAQTLKVDILPAKNLFDSPIADPKWPKFTMGVARDFKGSLGKRIWNFSFGENIGIAKIETPENSYEIGVQPAAFGMMDIASKPTKLVNTDYFIGLGVSHAKNNWQHLWQLAHTSSHVGDEYLLSSSNLKRINLSYETLKWYLRYKNQQDTAGLSPYGSVGYILHIDPNGMKRLLLSAGIDCFSDRMIFTHTTRLVAGVNFSAWQQNKYKGTFTARARVQFERTKFCNRFMQLLVEYQSGRSIQGQFYNKKVNSVGVLIAYSA